MNKNRLRAVSIVLIAVLLFPFTTFASDSTQAPQTGLVNNVINLEAQSKMTIYDVMLLPTSQGNQLAFKADIYNASNSELSFNYYWVRVLTKQGTRYNVKMMNEEQGTIVMPRSTKTFIFTALVDAEVKITDVQLQVIRWNFSIDNYEQHMGTVTIGSTYNPAVEWHVGKKVTIDSSPVQLIGDRYQVVTAGDNYDLRIDLNAWNRGKFTAKVPNFTYYLQTVDGLVYPVNLKSQDIQALPNSRSIISMQSTVPNSVDLKGLKLIIAETMNTATIPHMIMNLPAETIADEEQEVHDRYEYKTDDGVYSVTLKGFQRLPNNDTDIISIALELANEQNNTALPKLDLVASIILDNIELEPGEFEGIQLDNNLNIKKGNSIIYMFSAEIPYNFEFDRIQFNLSEKNGDNSYAIASFVNDASRFMLESTGIIRTETVGYRSTIYVNSSDIYQGNISDIIYTDVIMTNAEPRFTTLEQLVAFYKINGEIYFPAEIPDNKVLTMPSGKALIPITAEIPKGFEITSIELVLGTALKDTGLYKQAYIMGLPEADDTVIEDFQNIRISNYTISMEEVKLYISGGSASIRFEYDLSKDIYQHELTEHKLRFVIASDDRRYYSDVDLGKDLKVGKGTFEVPISGSDLITTIGKGYHIEIMDVYGVGEKLKAKSDKRYSWFSNSSL